MMPTKRSKYPNRQHIYEYNRDMLRSAVVSLFWGVISFKKKYGGFKLGMLSRAIGVDKSSPSRWFSGARPNWELNTISDIASALDVDLYICARDRMTNQIFTAQGLYSVVQIISADTPPTVTGGDATNPRLHFNPSPSLDVNMKIEVVGGSHDRAA